MAKGKMPPQLLEYFKNKEAKKDGYEGTIKEYNEEQNNKCATDVGKQRAADLEAGRKVSVETIKRMYSYLSRAEEYDTGNFDDCGTISYYLWGGDVMRRWAERVIKRENETK